MLTEKNGTKYWNGKKIPFIKNDYDINSYIKKEIETYNKFLECKDIDTSVEDRLSSLDQYKKREERAEAFFFNREYLTELGDLTTYMTTNDFYVKLNEYKPITTFQNQFVNYYTSKFFCSDKGICFEVNRFARYYNEKYNEFIANGNRIIKGANAEYDVLKYLASALRSNVLKIITNAYFDKYEHDVIVISEKGVYTLEIKNHSGTMHWEKGKFYEERRGAVENDVTNPYEQAINHKNSLCNVIDPKYVHSKVVFANDNFQFTCDDENIAKDLFYLSEFIDMFNAKEAEFSNSTAEQLFETIQSKRIYKENKFPYIDIDKLDSCYRRWLNEFNFLNTTFGEKSEESLYYLNQQIENEEAIGHYFSNIYDLNSVAMSKDKLYSKDYHWKNFILTILMITAFIVYVYLLVTKIQTHFFSFIYWMGVLAFPTVLAYTYGIISDYLYFPFTDILQYNKFQKSIRFANEMHRDNKKYAMSILREYDEKIPLLMKFYKNR